MKHYSLAALCLLLCLLQLVTSAQTQASLAFDGIDDRVIIADPSSEIFVSSFTIEAWVNPSSSFDGGPIFSKYDEVSAKQSVSLELSPTGAIEFSVVEQVSPLKRISVTSAAGIVGINNWNHIAASFDLPTSSLKLFLNGLELPISTLVDDGPLLSVAANDAQLLIGQQRKTTGFQHFEGLIDEVRIWELALVENQLSQLFQSEVSGNEPGLLLVFSFDEDMMSFSDDLVATCSPGRPPVGPFAGGTRVGASAPNNKPQFSTLTPQLLQVSCGVGCNGAFGDGSSLNFDGEDDYVDFSAVAPALVGVSDITVEFWFKADASQQTGGRSMLFSVNPAPPVDNKILFVLDNGTAGPNPGAVRIFEEDGGFELNGSINAGDNQWHHLAYVRSNGIGSLFIDGVLDGTHQSSTVFEATDRISLGQDFDNLATSDFFRGNITEFRIWDFARSNGEISAFISTELTGMESGLLSYFKFDDVGANPLLENCSTNNLTGVRLGTQGTNNLPAFTSEMPCITNVNCGIVPPSAEPGAALVIASQNEVFGQPGIVDVLLEARLTNTGDLAMEALSMELPLNTIPGFIGITTAPSVSLESATGQLPNPVNSYSGAGNIFDGVSGRLVDGEVLLTEVVVRFDASVVPVNSLLSAVGGGAANGALVTDISDAGVNPNPTAFNAGSPGDTGGTDDLTPLILPVFNTAKAISGVAEASSGANGNFNLFFDIKVENSGNVALTNVSIIDELTAQLGAAFVAVTSPPEVIEQTGPQGSVLPNLSFSGSGTQTNVINPATLAVSDSFTIRFGVEIDGAALTSDLTNQSNTTAEVGTSIIQDLSDEGFISSSTNSGSINDTGGADDATLISTCLANNQGGLTCNLNLNLSVDQSCQAQLEADDLLEGGMQTCLTGSLPAGGFYRIELFTPQGQQLLDLNPTTVSTLEVDLSNAIGQTLNYTISNVVDGTSCSGMILVEDKLAPVLVCPISPILATCLDDLSCVGVPTVTDNCGRPATVNLVSENLVASDECGVQVIERTYIAFDDQGNVSAPCAVTINIERVPVDFPADVEWTCEQFAAYPSIIDATPILSCIVDTDISDPILTVGLTVGADDDNCPGGEIDQAVQLTTCGAPLVCNLTTAAGGSGIACSGTAREGLEDDDILMLTGSGVPNVFDVHRGGLCKYNVSFEDQVSPVCGTNTIATLQVLRTWKVFNCCTNELTEHIQTIKVLDKIDPTISLPQNVELSANLDASLVCGSSGLLPIPTVTENCSGVDLTAISIASNPPVGQISPFFNNGILVGYQATAPYFEVGETYQVTYQIQDGCGNIASASTEVTVSDNTPPVVVCQGGGVDGIQLNLSGADADALFPSSVDDGSYDVCSADVYFKLMRMDELAAGDGITVGEAIACNAANNNDDDATLNFISEGATSVYFDDEAFFCCEDVGKTDLMVVMLVFDVDPGAGPIDPQRLQPGGDLFGRFNSCMSPVTVNTTIVPQLVCAQDVSLTCDQNGLIDTYLDQSLLTLDPPSDANGCGLSLQLQVDNNLDPSCGDGTISRTWSALDASGIVRSVCTQTITVRKQYSFTAQFPDDQVCVESLANVPQPTLGDFITQTGCSNVLLSIVDVPFSNEPKVIRKFSIDACDADVNLPPTLLPNPTSDLTGRTLVVTRNESVNPAIYEVSIDGQLISTNESGRFCYEQVIQLADDPTLTLQDNSAGCLTTVSGGICSQIRSFAGAYSTTCRNETVSFQLFNNVTDQTGDFIIDESDFKSVNSTALPVTLPNVSVNISGGVITVDGPFAYDTYALVVEVGDPSANGIEEVLVFTASDCESPIVTVGPNTTFCVMADQNRSSVITTSTFNATASDNCAVTSFQVGLQGNLAFPQLSLTIPDGLERITYNIDLIASDAAGATATKTVTLILFENGGSCVPMNRVAGKVETENGIHVEGVTMLADGDHFARRLTSTVGAFEFNEIDSGSMVTISPYLNASAHNGLTTYDIYSIGQHILGVEPLRSPYQLIAADANNSGSISAFDLTVIRRIILGLDDDFPAGQTSWRFVDASYQFQQPQQPWGENWPEEIMHLSLDEDELNSNFTAIKIGDVNQSARANARQPLAPRTYDESFALEIDNQVLALGEESLIELTSSAKDILGYQTTLAWNPLDLEILEIIPGSHKLGGFGTHRLEEGLLSLSHDGLIGESLFKLRIKSRRKRLDLSTSLSLSNTITSTEAFNANGPLELRLKFNQGHQDHRYTLSQNRPNPFTGETTIDFTLAKPGKATLIVHDAAGKAIWTLQQDYPAGLSSVVLSSKELGLTGVFTYTLIADSFTSTRKMILLE